MSNLPNSARVVIIGGGVVGCSVAYHLTKLGWKDVVLLERKQLTSGTTWHAAGLIAQLRATANMTKLAKYSQELYGSLEAETGVATGFKRVGSITVALSDERKEEIFRSAAMARAFGVYIEEISPSEVGARYPHLNLDGVKEFTLTRRSGIQPISRWRLPKVHVNAEPLFRNAESRAYRALDGASLAWIGFGRWPERPYCLRYDRNVEYQVGCMAGINVPLHARNILYCL